MLTLLTLLFACKHPDPAPTGEGLLLRGCPVQGEATARLLEDPAERPWGEESLAAPGDLLLMSSRAAFVIQGPDDPRTYYHYGGAPIDAVALSGCDQAGPELFEEMGFVVGRLNLTDFNSSSLHQIRATSIEIVSDGSDGGPAVVDVHAVDDRFWLVELTLIRNVWNSGGRNELGELFGLDITLRYTLDPDSATLQVSVLLDGQPAEDGFLVGALVFPSDRTTVHAFSNNDLRVGGFGMDLGVPWMAMGDGEGSSAIALPGANLAYTEVAGVRALLDANQAVEPLTVLDAPRPPHTDFLLAVGPTDSASASAALEPYLPDPIPDQPSTWEPLSGAVTDSAGQPVAGATIEVLAEAGPEDWRLLDRLISDEAGLFSGRTLSLGGDWRLVASQDGRDDGEEITLGPGGSAALSIGPKGSFTLDARDEDGQALPARVELERDDGRQRVLYAMPGEALPLAPGSYTAVVSRGYEHAIASGAVVVPDDGAATLSVSIPRLLHTEGWASTDTHVHAAPSADSDTLIDERFRTAAAAGLDSFVSTDHEAIIDLSASMDALPLVYGLGSEVTATVPEHINAWPFPPTDDPRGDPVRWYAMGFPGIYSAIRDRGARVIQLNHSRVNGECGILCVLDWDRLSESPGTDDVEALGLPVGTELWSWDFDSFEVMNSLRSPYLRSADPRHSGALIDWLSFHNLGHQVAAMAVTDIHGLDIPGSPRTYVRVPDDTDFTAEDLADGVLAGATLISAGAFAEASIGGVGAGGLARPGELSLRVQALPEIDVQEVVVLRNCDRVATVPMTDPDGLVKFDGTVSLDLTEDSTIVLIGIGEGAMPRGLEDYDARVVPRFLLSPIFVDGDGDGVWTAPGPKTCDTGLEG